MLINPSLKMFLFYSPGASSGIGAATAVEFAKLGIRLSIHGRNRDRLRDTQQRCIKQGLTEADVRFLLSPLY